MLSIDSGSDSSVTAEVMTVREDEPGTEPDAEEVFEMAGDSADMTDLSSQAWAELYLWYCCMPTDSLYGGTAFTYICGGDRP